MKRYKRCKHLVHDIYICDTHKCDVRCLRIRNGVHLFGRWWSWSYDIENILLLCMCVYVFGKYSSPLNWLIDRNETVWTWLVPPHTEVHLQMNLLVWAAALPHACTPIWTYVRLGSRGVYWPYNTLYAKMYQLAPTSVRRRADNGKVMSCSQQTSTFWREA